LRPNIKAGRKTIVKIVVCIKWVPDPEAPVAAFSVQGDGRIKVADYIPRMFGPYDENAIEAALQIKDRIESQVVLVCLGPRAIEENLREVLGTGAGMSILLDQEGFEGADSYGVARVLAEAIKKIGNADLVLCGRQASDTDAGIVGPALAERLGFPCATGVRTIVLEDKKFYVEQAADDRIRKMEMELPAVVSVTSENFTLRYATMPNIMAAMEKEVLVWGLRELGIGGEHTAENSLTVCLKSERPDNEINCLIIEGQDEEEKSANLVRRLAADKLL
jgi:electron transfer flavoprotein beta subunit